MTRIEFVRTMIAVAAICAAWAWISGSRPEESRLSAGQEVAPLPRVWDTDLNRWLDPPRNWNLPAAYMVDLDTESGSRITHFAAPDLETVKRNLRALIAIHGIDSSRKLRCRIWDRERTKWISLSGAELGQVGGWIPCEMTVHVGSARID